MQCHSILRRMPNVPEIYWVKAHAGMRGNEEADRSAKLAAQEARGIYKQQ